MSDFCNFTTVTKTRKPYWCAWCGEPIERGTSCVVASGVSDRDMFRDRVHHECSAANRAVQAEPGIDDVYWDGGYARGRTDDDRDSPPEFDVSGRRVCTTCYGGFGPSKRVDTCTHCNGTGLEPTAPDPSAGTP